MGLGSKKSSKEPSSGYSEPKEEKKEKKATNFDVETKIKKVEASKMPDDQKEEYIRKLKSDAAPKGKLISFAVYANIKKISAKYHQPMKSYPSAKGVASATLEGWDEIYKNF